LMKFCKTYRQDVPEALRQQIIDYKGLKALVKRCRPSSLEVSNSAAKCRGQDGFFVKLQREYVASSSFLRKRGDFCAKAQADTQLAVFRSICSGNPAAVAGGSAPAPEYAAKVTVLILMREQKALLKFADLSGKALVKITKKFDKHTRSTQGSRWLQAHAQQQQQPHAVTAAKLRQLLETAHTMLQQLAGLSPCHAPVWVDRVTYLIDTFDTVGTDAEERLRLEYSIAAARVHGSAVVAGVLTAAAAYQRHGCWPRHCLPTRLATARRYAEVVFTAHSSDAEVALAAVLDESVVAAGKACHVQLPPLIKGTSTAATAAVAVAAAAAAPTVAAAPTGAGLVLQPLAVVLGSKQQQCSVPSYRVAAPLF
jgi:hypothetical protein